MAELSLAPDQCLALRARAHLLDPVVLLGAAGLSEAVFKEIDRALNSHGLVKVRAGRTERADRDEIFRTMAEQLGAARVQAIGNTFVLFRPIPGTVPQQPAAARHPGAASKGAAKPAAERSAPRMRSNAGTKRRAPR